MATTLELGVVLAALAARYPAERASDWDAVGLVCGDPQEPIERILFAVDPVAETVDEAIALGAGLLVTHHPLFLEPVHGVPADDPKGRLVHRLVRSGVALFVAHTNADAATPGVSDALASALGLVDVGPLTPDSDIGRIGRVSEPVRLGDFARSVARALPATAGGVKVSGDLDAEIRRVAVCGGAGGSLLAAVIESGADVYVTSDLSHHRALDARAGGLPAIIDVAHWAGEWPWLEQAAQLLRVDLGVSTVDVAVSTRCTDPWTWQGSTN